MLRLFRARAERYARESSDSAHVNRTWKSSSAASSQVNGDSHARDTQQEPRVVYICPIKALGYEKHQQWTSKFPFLRVVIETGDQEKDGVETMQSIMDANVLVTTPERWDSITRRWKEATVLAFVASVKLLLLDEVHSVAEDRGAALEAVVNRMKTIKATMQQMRERVQQLAERSVVRFVAISATLPNVEDMAAWLHVDSRNVFTFPESTRPVPLHVRVVSFPPASRSSFAFDRFLSFKLFGVIKAHSDGRPTLVFCASRKDTVSSATLLCDELKRVASREGREDLLADPTADAMRLSEKATDKQLRAMLRFGIAFHHGAMSPHDRRLVEDMFRMQYVSCICTTTTLAMGVNLPARLVVIKGTTFFKNGTREDLPMSEIMQMSGRAGRPGMDTHGVAVILTSDDKTRLYERLETGQCAASIVESRLHLHMVEHVNAEVALRTIHNVAMGIDWLKTTLFWIRLRKNPRYYGLNFQTAADEKQFDREKYASQLMTEMLKVLQQEHCVRLSGLPESVEPDGCVVADNEEEEDQSTQKSSSIASRVADPFDNEEREWELKQPRSKAVISTRTGRAMARLYIDFDTVCTFNEYIRSHCVNMQESKSDDDTNEVTSVEAATSSAQHSRRQSIPTDASVVAQLNQSSSTGSTPVNIHRFTVREVLEVLSRASEFTECRLRQGDKKSLNDMNKKVKFPLNTGNRGGRDVRETWHKVFLLIQSQLSATAIALEDFSIRNDVLRMWNSLPRLAKFASSYADDVGSFSYTRVTILLLRSIERKIWWDDPDLIKQFLGNAEGVMRALRNSGLHTFQDVLRTAPRKLEVLCGKPPPFGTDLLRKCSSLPRLQLKVRGRWNSGNHVQNSEASGVPEIVVFTHKPTSGPANAASTDTCPQTEAPPPPPSPNRDPSDPFAREETSYYYFTLLAGIVDTDEIVLQRRFKVQLDRNGEVLSAPTDTTIPMGDGEREVQTFRIPPGLFSRSANPSHDGNRRSQTWIRVHLLCERIIGVDTSLTVQFLPADGIFTSHTEGAEETAGAGMNETEPTESSDVSVKPALSSSLVAVDSSIINKSNNKNNNAHNGSDRPGESESNATTKRPRSNSQKPFSSRKPSTSPKRHKCDQLRGSKETGEECTKGRTEFDKLLRDLRWVEEGTSKTPPLSPNTRTVQKNRHSETSMPAVLPEELHPPMHVVCAADTTSFIPANSPPPSKSTDNLEAATPCETLHETSESINLPQSPQAIASGRPQSPQPFTAGPQKEVVESISQHRSPAMATQSRTSQSKLSTLSVKTPNSFLIQKEKLLRQLTEQDTDAATQKMDLARSEVSSSSADAAMLNSTGTSTTWDSHAEQMPSSLKLQGNTQIVKPVKIRPMSSPPAIPPPGAFRVMHCVASPPCALPPSSHKSASQHPSFPYFTPPVDPSASYGRGQEQLLRNDAEYRGFFTPQNQDERRNVMRMNPNPRSYDARQMHSYSDYGTDEASFLPQRMIHPHMYSNPIPQANRHSWYSSSSSLDDAMHTRPSDSTPYDWQYQNSEYHNIHSTHVYPQQPMSTHPPRPAMHEFHSFTPVRLSRGGGGGAYEASVSQSPATATSQTQHNHDGQRTHRIPGYESSLSDQSWQRDISRDEHTRYGFTINIGSSAADGNGTRPGRPERRATQRRSNWDDGGRTAQRYSDMTPSSASSWGRTPPHSEAVHMNDYRRVSCDIPEWPTRPAKSHPYVRPQRRTAPPDMFPIWQSNGLREPQPHAPSVSYESSQRQSQQPSQTRFFRDMHGVEHHQIPHPSFISPRRNDSRFF